MIWLKLLIALWLLCSVYYHVQNISMYQEHPRSANWAIFCKYLRFLEMTMLQCLAGAVTSAIVLKLAKTKHFLPLPKFNKKVMAVVVVGHLTGTLAVNAAVSIRSLHGQNLFRSFEPVVAYLLLWACNDFKIRNSAYLPLSLVLISTGLYLFIRDENFRTTPWGSIAAVVALLMFSVRNVCLTWLGETWKDPVEKYLVVSSYSFVILLPIVLIKLVYTKIVPLVNPVVALESILFNVADNFISVLVLELFSPIFHTVLRAFIQYSIGIVSAVYLSRPLHWLTAIGFIIFLVGQMVFQKTYTSSNSNELKRFVITSTCILSFILGGNLLWNGKFNANMDIKQQSSTVVYSFWAYDKPPSRDILLDMEKMHHRTPEANFHVFCGTYSCARKVRAWRSYFSTTFLRFNDFVRGSPLEKWFKAHSLHKILFREDFENHLHEATRLALLWRYGATIVDPFLRIRKAHFPELQNRNSWITRISKDNSSSMLYVCQFKKHHPFVEILAKIFMKLYYRLCYLKARCKELVSAFNSESWDALGNFCTKNHRTCPGIVEIAAERINPRPKYYFDIQFEKFKTNFLTVGIQNMAISQFAPYVRTLMSRDDNSDSARNDSPSRKGNARFTAKPFDFFAEILGQPQNYLLEYMASLRNNLSVGCLGTKAKNELKAQDVEAYLCGGTVFLMKTPLGSGISRKGIYIMNLNESTIKQLPAKIQDYGVRLSLGRKSELSLRSWFKSVHALLRKIAAAKLVITSDILCASVSVAFDAPVFLVTARNTSNKTNHLLQMFHTWDQRNQTLSTIVIKKLLSGQIPAVSDIGLFMRLRAKAWNAVRKHETALESALKFGVVPFSRPRFNAAKGAVFHLIFTTSEKSLISVEDTSVKGSFVWRHWRCVESIFYHHPLATVVIHSNTLQSRVFDVLTEAGYEIQVNPYSLADLAKGNVSKLSGVTMNQEPRRRGGGRAPQ